MKLIVVHRIFIGSAIGLCAVFAVRSILFFVRGGTSADLAIAAGSIALGAALSVYFVKLRGRKE